MGDFYKSVFYFCNTYYNKIWRDTHELDIYFSTGANEFEEQ